MPTFKEYHTKDNGRVEQEIILRRQPVSGLLEPYDVSTEFRVLDALRDTGVAIPRTYWYEPDPQVFERPFYAMEKVDGHVHFLTQQTDPDYRLIPDDQERASLAEDFVTNIVRIHTCDWRALGLGFLGDPGPARGSALRQTGYWEEVIERAGYRRKPLVTLAVNWLRNNAPQNDTVRLIHGDYRSGNYIYRDRRIRAVLDWEMVHLGDPHQDLVYVLGEAIDDYLKAIWLLAEQQRRVITTALARHLGITPAAVTGMLQRLSAQDRAWVIYEKSRGVALTKEGHRRALEILRHHRLIELFLQKTLGLSWDRVHAEAERLEHVISESLEDSIAEHLGNPETDPHGSPIPRKDGSLPEREEHELLSIGVGTKVTVSRLEDRNPEFLQYLGSAGLLPGVRVTVESVEPFGGPIMLRVRGRSIALGREAASQNSCYRSSSEKMKLQYSFLHVLFVESRRGLLRRKSRWARKSYADGRLHSSGQECSGLCDPQVKGIVHTISQ